jgi:hypothetical protein
LTSQIERGIEQAREASASSLSDPKVEPRHNDILAAVVETESGILLPELPVGHCNIDLAAVDELSLRGYEFKSSGDTIGHRAETQARQYERFFDYLVWVVAERHAEAVDRLISPWVGLEVLNADCRIIDSRPSCPNPNVDLRLIAQSFWQTEAVAELRARGITLPSRTRRYESTQILADALTGDELRAAFRHRLMHRKWGPAYPGGPVRRVIRKAGV